MIGVSEHFRRVVSGEDAYEPGVEDLDSMVTKFWIDLYEARERPQHEEGDHAV